MTDRDKSILEYPEKMCEYCCNFDKEHIGMDGMALCQLTMTLAYAEDYGGNCMFYNVPKEQIIVPPCKAGGYMYTISRGRPKKWKVCFIGHNTLGEQKYHLADEGYKHMIEAWDYDIGKTVFLSREDAEKALKERSEGK